MSICSRSLTDKVTVFGTVDACSIHAGSTYQFMSIRLTKIQSVLTALNQPGYRLTQIQTAIYQDHFFEFSQMSGLPLVLRQALQKELGEILSLKPVKVAQGKEAVKILFTTEDGHSLESVMTFNHSFVCLSSMSGCNLGCKFCSTGTMGLRKKLTVDEIIDQVLYFEKNYGFHGHITFMGMGEPLLNEEAIFPALKILITVLNYGQRKISLSTVGIVPGINRLTKEFPQVNLALSLHSAEDGQRSELMPVNKLYPIAEVMAAVNQHLQTTKRKIFLAYLLLNNINDTLAHAAALVKLIKSQGNYSYLYHVNLIQYHASLANSDFKRSSAETRATFSQYLTKNKIPNTIRKSFGEDIQAACGQLYAKMGLP